jgi:hypothetical protein
MSNGQCEPCTHLLQGLHKLLHRDGAAQQRLQHFAVRQVLTHSLPLLTAGGLGGPGRGLGQKESRLSLSASSDSSPSGPVGVSSLIQRPWDPRWSGARAL